MADSKVKVKAKDDVLGILEEDDEFEEFPAETFTDVKDDLEEEVKVWQDNWDDDLVEDDFSSQLKAELINQSAQNGKPEPKMAKLSSGATGSGGKSKK